ncbi:MAG: threonylcarbamoyl-AMP synthase [Betaproteobacteria bacterium]|nr:MAG: threonylcarbamoyl-AMP synthase [Betaproteobacteria bacterium]
MNPTILSGTRSNIALAAAALRRGEIVGMPTETVYGLAADAGNAAALAKVFAAKGRPADHPLIVHVANTATAKTWASVWPETAQKLADAFWPGPMTLIVQRAAHVLDAVTGGQSTVGIRVPAHPLALALLKAFGGAVAAPSANKFGHVSPTTAAHVAAEFSDSNLLILDGGACDIGVESTIIDVSSSRPRVLRPGRIRSDDIEQLLGVRLSSVEPTEAPRVSGSLDSHYAPRTKTLMLVTEALNLFLDAARDAGKRVGLIHYSSQLSTKRVKQRVTLDGNNAQQFEHDIYAKLRMLDDAALDLIVIEAPPTDGHWDAVNDRLRRASFSSR